MIQTDDAEKLPNYIWTDIENYTGSGDSHCNDVT